DLVLKREEDAGAVDEVDERQAVLGGDALGAEDLLAGHGEEGTGLDRGVVGDDHDPTAVDRGDAGDDAGRGGAAPLLVHAACGPQPDLEEGGARVGEAFDALAGGEPSLLVLAADGFFAAAQADDVFLLVDGLGQTDEFAGHRESTPPRLATQT